MWPYANASNILIFSLYIYMLDKSKSSHCKNFSYQWQPSPQQIICGSKTYQMQAHQESSGQPGDFGPIHWHGVIVIRIWISNYIHTFLWDIITDPCLLASCASAKLFLKLGHWWAITSWWRHQMKTFSALLAICAGNSPVPVNSPHKGKWRGALMFSLICVWINGWVNNREAGDLRCYRAHYDVTVMHPIVFCEYDLMAMP